MTDRSTDALTIRPFAEADLPHVMAMLEAEGRDTYVRDARRTLRVLTAPGATSLLAASDLGTAGLALALSDGEINAYLALVVVAREMRGLGIGRALVREVARRTGAQRLDLLSEADRFFESLGAEQCSGFRLAMAAVPR
jgi:GNAT superfamily N-acetyltransferase